MGDNKHRTGQSGGSSEANHRERSYTNNSLFSSTIWYKQQQNTTPEDLSLTHILLNHGDPAMLFLSNDVVNNAVPYETRYYPILIKEIIKRATKFNGNMKKFLKEWINQEVLSFKRKERSRDYLMRLYNRLQSR